MNAKEYLNQGFLINERIDAKLEQIAMLRSLATKTSVTLSDMPGDPNKGKSRVEAIVVKIIGLQEEISADIDRLVDLRKEIMGVIDEVEDPEESLVLNLRYINNLSWEDIASQMDCSVRSVHRIHGRALENIVIS
ncbi:MAG: DUF1492 domain-containing protein [Butyrivibrio sp.]|nr:DUF1492 domain-containing protein [Butyrivibrio sp.]